MPCPEMGGDQKHTKVPPQEQGRVMLQYAVVQGAISKYMSDMSLNGLGHGCVDCSDSTTMPSVNVCRAYQ